MVRRHMAKKAAKKSSSSRRVTARPLGFWQFIRKNFLIISGLLLLPVTVGAVVSSYNYANQGSAAGRNTFNTQALKECSTVPGISSNKVAAGTCVKATNTENGYCRCLGGDFVIEKQYRCGLNSSCQDRLAVPTVASPVCTSKEYKPLGCKSCLVVCRTRDGKSLDDGIVEVTDFGCNQEIRKVPECGAPSPAPTSPPADTGRGGGYNPNCPAVNCNACGSEGQGCCQGTDFQKCCVDTGIKAGACGAGLQCINGGCSRPAAPTSAPTSPPPVSSNDCSGSLTHDLCKNKRVGEKFIWKYDSGTPVYWQCFRTEGNNCGVDADASVTDLSAGFDVKKAIRNFFGGIFGF